MTVLGDGGEQQTYQVNMQQVAPQEDFRFIVTQTQEVSEKEIPFSVIDEGIPGRILEKAS